MQIIPNRKKHRDYLFIFIREKMRSLFESLNDFATNQWIDEIENLEDYINELKKFFIINFTIH